jgi:hypothetical protein
MNFWISSLPNGKMIHSSITSVIRGLAMRAKGPSILSWLAVVILSNRSSWFAIVSSSLPVIASCLDEVPSLPVIASCLDEVPSIWIVSVVGMYLTIWVLGTIDRIS